MNSATLASSRKLSTVLLAAVLLGIGACGPNARTSDDTHGNETASETTATDAHAGDSAEHGHPAGSDSAITLLAIMQRLGGNMAALTHGLMTDDTAAVRQQASAIAEHAPIATADLERIKRALGADMGTFEAVDESVHVAAVALSDAARTGQFSVVLSRLSDVQRGCVSCHAQFRERLLTNRSSR